jgi:hypothetical protein
MFFQRGTELLHTWDKDHKRDFIALVPGTADDGDLSRLFRPGVIKVTSMLLSWLPPDVVV